MTTNKFYTPPADLAQGTKARSADVNALSQAANTAFDKLPDPIALSTGTVTYAVAGGAGNAYTAALASIVTAYQDGLEVKLLPGRDNTGPATLNVNGLGALAIKRFDGTDPIAGDLSGGSSITLAFSASTNTFRMPPTANGQLAIAAASAAAAAQSASAAGNSAQASSGSATASNTSAQNASAAAALAASWATAIAASVDGTYYGARYYAIAASGSATAAANSAGAASTSAGQASTSAQNAASAAAGAVASKANTADLAAVGVNTPQPAPLANLDAINNLSGLYLVNANTAGSKPTAYGVAEVKALVAQNAGNSNWVHQVFYGADGRTYTRSSINGGAWSAWRDAMQDSTGNVNVGAVNGGPLAGYRNRYINGCMWLDQRNLAGVLTASSANKYPMGPDRWYCYGDRANGNAITYQRTAPGGARPYWLTATNTTGGALGVQDNVCIGQNIESLNMQGLNWGTPTAKPVTISFWVNVSVAGTYAYSIRDGGLSVSYVTTFNVPVANVDTYITLTIPGPTAGSWVGASNGVGAFTSFDLGIGSALCTSAYNQWNASASPPFGANITKLSATTGARFSMTEIQFESGPVATPYEFRLYGVEYLLCLRYFFRTDLCGAVGVCNAAGGDFGVRFPVPMRTNPSLQTFANGTFVDGFNQISITSFIYPGGTGLGARVGFNASGTTAGRGCVFNGDAALGFNAEL